MDITNTTEKKSFKQKLEDKITDNFDADERLDKLSKESLATFGVISFFYFIGRLAYEGIAHHKLAIPELIMFILCLLILAIYEKDNNIYTFPSYLGHKLNTDKGSKAKRSRTLLYLGESALIAFILSAIDVIQDGVPKGTQWLSIIASFSIVTLVAFLFHYLTTERKIKKYHAYLDRLEAEENDLSD